MPYFSRVWSTTLGRSATAQASMIETIATITVHGRRSANVIGFMEYFAKNGQQLPLCNNRQMSGAAKQRAHTLDSFWHSSSNVGIVFGSNEDSNLWPRRRSFETIQEK